MLGGSSCCGNAKGGAKNPKKIVVKPKRVVKKIKGGNTESGTEPVSVPVKPEPEPVKTEPEPVKTEPVPVTGGAKKTKKRVVKPKKIVKKYGKRKGGYADPLENEEEPGEEEPGKEEPGEEDDTVEDGTVEGGAKKKKGSVVVKRALTPYNKFVKKNFAIMKKKFPDEKAPQIMKKIAIEWKKTKK
jgi:hypothetical protein